MQTFPKSVWQLNQNDICVLAENLKIFLIMFPKIFFFNKTKSDTFMSIWVTSADVCCTLSSRPPGGVVVKILTSLTVFSSCIVLTNTLSVNLKSENIFTCWAQLQFQVYTVWCWGKNDAYTHLIKNVQRLY